MQVEIAEIFSGQPVLGGVQPLILFEFIKNFIEGEQLGMGLVHLCGERADILGTDIGIAVNTGIGHSLLVDEIINKIGVVQLFVCEAVQLGQVRAVLCDKIIQLSSKIFIKFKVNRKIHRITPVC